MLTARKTAEPQAETSKETASPEGNDGGARKTEPATPRELQELFRRIEGEYREIPGLSLTVSQAERLWGLDRSTCEFALAKLVERRVLTRAMDGGYVRGSLG